MGKYDKRILKWHKYTEWPKLVDNFPYITNKGEIIEIKYINKKRAQNS